MTEKDEHYLLEDTLSDNFTDDNDHFLKFNVSVIHADTITLGPHSDKDKCDTSINHWVLILETTKGSQVRLSMEYLDNDVTGEFGVLVVKHRPYTGKSMSAVNRESFTWTGPTTTIQTILEHALKLGWHKYKFTTISNGKKKGCRFHLYVEPTQCSK